MSRSYNAAIYLLRVEPHIFDDFSARRFFLRGKPLLLVACVKFRRQMYHKMFLRVDCACR